MNKLNKKITIGTSFAEDSNQADITKVLSSELEKNHNLWDMTAVHQYYMYEDFDTRKLNYIRIKGKYLRVREKETFDPNHKILRSDDNIRMENFMIWIWEMKTPFYKRFREWSEIPEDQKTLGVMDIICDDIIYDQKYSDQFYIDFSVIIKPTQFKSISKKLLNKKDDEEYDFFFDIDNSVENKPKKQLYCTPILDFRLVKRPALY
jgi:hypothetical protein